MPAMTPDSRPEITHESHAARFVARTPEGLALCSYRREPGPLGEVLVLHHTEVPAALEGRGLASALVAAALAWARQEGLRVRPVCSYVAAYMRRHPDTLDLLADAPAR
jgi:predicted GNAT family acetyltransferase